MIRWLKAEASWIPVFIVLGLLWWAWTFLFE